jgi:excisionase family DNA binding protein
MHSKLTVHDPFGPHGTRSEKLAFTIAEACAAIGIGKTSLYALISEGKLKAIKAAGRRLILRSDLEAYLLSCRDTS